MMISSGLGERECSDSGWGWARPSEVSVIRVFFVPSVGLRREIKRVRTRSLQRELLLSRFGVGENDCDCTEMLLELCLFIYEV